jgi:hypothetical protein
MTMDEKNRKTAEELAGDLYDACVASGPDAVIRELLARRARDTGENRYRYAEQIIAGKKPGRTPIDDSEAIRQIKNCPPSESRTIIGKLSRIIANKTGERPESVARRLREKTK